MWKLVPAAVTLRKQIDTRFPRRDHASDGTIGDVLHSQRVSDHNPDHQGWVHALDIDDDLGAPGDAQRLADQLLAYARSGKPGADRIKYIVYADKIASGTHRTTYWTWRPSNERNHRNHIHVSFTDAAEDDPSAFPLPILEPVKAPAKPSTAKKTPSKKTTKKAVS